MPGLGRQSWIQQIYSLFRLASDYLQADVTDILVIQSGLLQGQ
jgi:hypothetical protein